MCWFELRLFGAVPDILSRDNLPKTHNVKKAHHIGQSYLPCIVMTQGIEPCNYLRQGEVTLVR